MENSPISQKEFLERRGQYLGKRLPFALLFGFVLIVGVPLALKFIPRLWFEQFVNEALGLTAVTGIISASVLLYLLIGVIVLLAFLIMLMAQKIIQGRLGLRCFKCKNSLLPNGASETQGKCEKCSELVVDYTVT